MPFMKQIHCKWLPLVLLIFLFLSIPLTTFAFRIDAMFLTYFKTDEDVDPANAGHTGELDEPMYPITLDLSFGLPDTEVPNLSFYTAMRGKLTFNKDQDFNEYFLHTALIDYFVPIEEHKIGFTAGRLLELFGLGITHYDGGKVYYEFSQYLHFEFYAGLKVQDDLDWDQKEMLYGIKLHSNPFDTLHATFRYFLQIDQSHENIQRSVTRLDLYYNAYEILEVYGNVDIDLTNGDVNQFLVGLGGFPMQQLKVYVEGEHYKPYIIPNSYWTIFEEDIFGNYAINTKIFYYFDYGLNIGAIYSHYFYAEDHEGDKVEFQFASTAFLKTYFKVSAYFQEGINARRTVIGANLQRDIYKKYLIGGTYFRFMTFSFYEEEDWNNQYLLGFYLLSQIIDELEAQAQFEMGLIDEGVVDYEVFLSLVYYLDWYH